MEGNFGIYSEKKEMRTGQKAERDVCVPDMYLIGVCHAHFCYVYQGGVECIFAYLNVVFVFDFLGFFIEITTEIK